MLVRRRGRQLRSNRILTGCPTPGRAANTELVIITGLSGSGKGTVLKAFEDLGYYSVDNLPLDLIPKFAELTKRRAEHPPRGAGGGYSRRRGAGALPRAVQAHPAEDSHAAAVSRSRRRDADPPLQRNAPSASAGNRTRASPPASGSERERLAPIRRLADPIINTSKFNVHELRETIHQHLPRPEARARRFWCR